MPPSVVMTGATGAVGLHCARTLAGAVPRLTLLGRREAAVTASGPDTVLSQHLVDLGQPGTYAELLRGHEAAVCTVGVGEPSAVDRDTFVRIDKELPLAFATACKEAGVRHFSLLSSVGVGAGSSSFHLRTKGELEDGLRALGFARLSLFHPSMILTPTNRYGASQAVVLAVWPLLTPLLQGPARRLRGVPVARLGRAIARNVLVAGNGEETLEWDDFLALGGR